MKSTMRARWGLPAFGLLLGAAMLAASAVGGQAGLGLGMFAVMATYSGALVVFAGSSDTLGVLRGQPADERLASFDLAATAVAGVVAIVAAIAGFLWEIAHGRSGFEFALVAAAAGVGYLVALLWFRRRR
jgi:hypothetical protein